MAAKNLKAGRHLFNWNNSKSLYAMMLDSVIIGGLTALALLPGLTFPTVNELYIASKAFLIAFFGQLAFERGLKKLKK